MPYITVELNRPAYVRDCVDCGAKDAMKLQNVVGRMTLKVVGSKPMDIPLLYICQQCGTMLTIPPPTKSRQGV